MDLPRRLSDVEAAFAYTHALMHGTTQVTTHFTVSGDFGADHLRQTAERWAGDLPLLSLRIEEQHDGLWFRTGPGPRPAQIRQSLLIAPASPDDILRQELNSVLETGGPLWRLHIVRAPEAGATHFYFTRNHAISDGHSTGALVRAFLDILFAPAVGADGASPYDVRSVAPNGDELTYRPPARPDDPLRRPVVRPEPVPFADHRPWGERGTDFVPLALNRRESVVLRAWCKSRGTTVNQFFAVALAESFVQMTGRSDVALFTAVSTRRRYEESALLPDVGCFINVVGVPLRFDEGDLAGRAHDYAAVLGRADAVWRPPRREHAAIRRAVDDAAAAQASPGICITNVGVVDPALGPHASRVTGYRTVVNRTGANYGVVLHLATLRGVFTMAFAFGTPSTDRATVRSVAKALRDRALRPDAVGRGLPVAART